MWDKGYDKEQNESSDQLYKTRLHKRRNGVEILRRLKLESPGYWDSLQRALREV